MKKLILLILFITISMSACTVKQGELVVLENIPNENQLNKYNFETIKLDTIPQKAMIQKRNEVISTMPKELIPISVSPDYDTILSYIDVSDTETDNKNSNLICGNMVGKIKLYSYKTSTKNLLELGVFQTLRDYKFDESGKLFAFIDGKSNVYILNTENELLEKVLNSEKYRTLSTLNWSRDSKRLMFDTKIIFDIASKEFISIAAESHTPFIKQKLNDNTYITQMKNLHYYDMITLYDFNTKTFNYITNGVYQDSDNEKILYTGSYSNDLSIINFKTMENVKIYEGIIYKAYLLKSTGQIIYSILNKDYNVKERYSICLYDPASNNTKIHLSPTPTFYLSPAEDELYFVSDYCDNKIYINVNNFNIVKKINTTESEDQAKIKSTILKMFELDYNFSGSYEEFINNAKKIYMNSYDIIPQEALENKLKEYKKHQAPLPTWQKEPYFPANISINNIKIQKNHASLDIGFFFVNSIEMQKLYDDWYITGLSTHPYSKEIKEIKSTVENYISLINLNNYSEVKKITKTNIDIPSQITSRKEGTMLEIGEIELWSGNNTHRAESPEIATHARVKIIIRNNDEIQKYILILYREYKKNFEIIKWDI